jgi:hypothetical protein
MPNGSTKSTSSLNIKRPRNSWIIYRSQTLKVLSESPVECRRTQQELSKLISAKWRQESKQVKDVYNRLAEMEKNEHKLLHPEYVYRPKRKSRGQASSQVEKPTIRIPNNMTRAQPLIPNTTPANSESANLTPSLASEELQDADFICPPNCLNQSQVSAHQVGTEMCLKVISDCVSGIRISFSSKLRAPHV